MRWISLVNCVFPHWTTAGVSTPGAPSTGLTKQANFLFLPPSLLFLTTWWQHFRPLRIMYSRNSARPNKRFCGPSENKVRACGTTPANSFQLNVEKSWLLHSRRKAAYFPTESRNCCVSLVCRDYNKRGKTSTQRGIQRDFYRGCSASRGKRKCSWCELVENGPSTCSFWRQTIILQVCPLDGIMHRSRII